MKILKRIYILLLSAVLIIGGSGCGVKNESSETKKPEPTLNEWQKDFLTIMLIWPVLPILITMLLSQKVSL